MSDSTKYMIEDSMLKRFDRVKRSQAYTAKTLRSDKAWREKTIKTLKALTGYNSMQKTDPKPRITEEKSFKTYTQQRIEIFTEPGVLMPFYVLIPKTSSGPFPAILAPHGHCGGGKYPVVGYGINKEVKKAIMDFNYDYGVKFAEAGYIAFCPDARGFGERQERFVKGKSILDESCREINNMAYPLGQTMTGMLTWDMHRLIDYAQSRDDVIKSRIACAGLSGGGYQTLWASAWDKRIKCSIISGYMYGYKESLLEMHNNCSCNYVPHLYETVDMGDILALLAPRPVLIETGTKDPLNGRSGVKNVKSQMTIARKAYRLHGAEKDLQHDIFEGGHRWNGVKTIPFLNKYL